MRGSFGEAVDYELDFLEDVVVKVKGEEVKLPNCSRNMMNLPSDFINLIAFTPTVRFTCADLQNVA